MPRAPLSPFGHSKAEASTWKRRDRFLPLTTLRVAYCEISRCSILATSRRARDLRKDNLSRVLGRTGPLLQQLCSQKTGIPGDWRERDCFLKPGVFLLCDHECAKQDEVRGGFLFHIVSIFRETSRQKVPGPGESRDQARGVTERNSLSGRGDPPVAPATPELVRES